MLVNLVKLASLARLDGIPNDVLLNRAFEEKESMKRNGTIGKCSRGQMLFRDTAVDQITLGLNGSKGTIGHVPTVEDMKNGLHLYAIFCFCPENASKIGQFLESLVSTSSPRTILLSLVNSLESTMLSKMERVMLGKFYEALNKIMDLRFGKILLAYSSPSKLEAMLAEDLPFIMPYSQVIKDCLYESKCAEMVGLIETIGNTIHDVLIHLLYPQKQI